MDEKEKTITFTTEDGDEVVFTVIEETMINGTKYLLVLDGLEDEDEDMEEEALILKDISSDTDSEAIYEIVDDDKELDAVAGIFDELLDDYDLEK